MKIQQFQEIEAKYGDMSSWAVWKPKDEKGKEKSNIGDTTIFPTHLERLQTDFVFVGLNISKKLTESFGNFHSTSSRAHDYKIRYAVKDTAFYGAYMTDIIKDFEEKASGNVMKYIKQHENFLLENIASFKQELNDIGSTQPVLIAFGNDCYNILKKHFEHSHKIFKVSHYSSCVTKEQLRGQLKEVWNKINT